jgi:hypothetical protein
MASRCTCDRIEALLEGLPWFKALPGGARWLCFKLVKLMATPAYDGAIPFSDPARVSLLVSMEGTETETHLETLIEKGLLARDDAGRLLCPAMEGISARARAARENGRKGGRPRKDAPVTPQNDARQVVAKLPIPGGLAKPSETQRWETPSAGAAPRTTTSTEGTTTESGAWQELAQKAIAVAGLSMKRPDWTVARDWLEAGHSAEHVLAVVADVAARPGFRAESVTTLRYFSPAIARQASAGPAPVAAGLSINPDGDSPLARAIRAWEESGHRGPCPTLATLRAA